MNDYISVEEWAVIICLMIAAQLLFSYSEDLSVSLYYIGMILDSSYRKKYIGGGP